MADLGLELGLPTRKASLLTASQGSEGLVILLGPQIVEDMSYDSDHRTFLEDPGGLWNLIHFPDLGCVFHHFHVLIAWLFPIVLAATDTQLSMFRMGVADSCYSPVLTRPMAGVSDPLGLTCLFSQCHVTGAPVNYTGPTVLCLCAWGSPTSPSQSGYPVDASMRPAWCPHMCKRQVWGSHALWGKGDLCPDSRLWGIQADRWQGLNNLFIHGLLGQPTLLVCTGQATSRWMGWKAMHGSVTGGWEANDRVLGTSSFK